MTFLKPKKRTGINKWLLFVNDDSKHNYVVQVFEQGWLTAINQSESHKKIIIRLIFLLHVCSDYSISTVLQVLNVHTVVLPNFCMDTINELFDLQRN